MVTFRPAVRGDSSVMLGIAGPSRSGKTYSALRVATGMAQGGPIFLIDTESRRALQYADRFAFLHSDMAAPFASERYMKQILAARDAKAAVIIVDSASHEHEGPGGILEQHEAKLQKMAGNDYAKRDKLKFTAWIEPKAAHNRYVNTILQVNVHMIFCFRAKDKLELRKGDDGKIVPTPVGWTPICTDRFEYEMTSMLLLPEGARGVPDLNAKASGLREPIDRMIKPGQVLDEAFGKRLAEWARGATPKETANATTQAPADTGQQTQENTAPPENDAPVDDWLAVYDEIVSALDLMRTIGALKTLWNTDRSVTALKNGSPDLAQKAYQHMLARIGKLKRVAA